MDITEAARIEQIVNLVTSLQPNHAKEHNPARPSARLNLSVSEIARYSFAEAILYLRSSMKVNGKRGGFEYECSEELRRRGYDIPLGSIAIPTDVLERRVLPAKYFVGVSAPQGLTFVDMLRSLSVLYRLGAIRITDLQNDVGILRQTVGTAMTWVDPSGSVTAQDSQFGMISGTPRIGVAITDVSEQLLRQSAAHEIISAGLAADFAVGIDVAGISGAGGKEPLGILNVPGIGTVSGASLGYTGLVSAQKTIADANAIVDPRSVGYITTPTVAELLKNRQRFTSTDSPLWKGSIFEGEIEGVPALATKNVPTSTMLFGDFSNVAIGEWGPMALSVDNSGTRFNQAQVGIRALWMVDVLVLRPLSFLKITSIT